MKTEIQKYATILKSLLVEYLQLHVLPHLHHRSESNVALVFDFHQEVAFLLQIRTLDTFDRNHSFVKLRRQIESHLDIDYIDQMDQCNAVKRGNYNPHWMQ